MPEANKTAIALDLAVTESAAQYLDDIAGLSTSSLLSAGKTADGQLIATKAPVLLDDVTESDLILPQTQQIAAKHGFHAQPPFLSWQTTKFWVNSSCLMVASASSPTKKFLPLPA